ncbi:hypothetical protein HDU96_004201 [Phlyctochytrium bullatum]|nr:hypothetical protein HDU96_004201 [Phlyctochytrium bullatum]
MHPLHILLALAAVAIAAVHAAPIAAPEAALDQSSQYEMANKDRQLVPPLKRRNDNGPGGGFARPIVE